MLRDRTHRSPTTDYTVVYQDATVGFTTADLLANDDDPQGQTLTVVAVSEPSNDGVLTGSLATGFTYTPSNDPALIDTDHQINYLVADTDGHVTQGLLHHPHPRHRRPQPTTRRRR